MRVREGVCMLGLLFCAAGAAAADAPALPGQMLGGVVYDDRDGDGRRDRGEPGVAGVLISNGRALAETDAAGRYRIAVAPGQTVFVIKPAGWRVPQNDPARPGAWRHVPALAPPSLKYGGIASGPMPRSFDIGLRRAPSGDGWLEVRVFADPQVKSAADVDYFARDIVDSVLAEGTSRSDAREQRRAPELGLSLGDIVDDELSLYPALNAQTRRIGVPWLHVAGNHDLDFDVAHDEDSLLTFRNTFGPDTFAWEEDEAVFVGLDDVIYQPGQSPAYIGGLRDDQFAFLEAYLPRVPKQRLLVLAMHIPLFEYEGRDTFRDADRARLFALLRDFPNVLILSGHSHAQQHWMHDARTGWQGAAPLHEYNVGAACGAFWTGVKDASGIPDTTMSDGTPNGYASLGIGRDGRYALAWHAARDPQDAQIGLHAPKVLRRGAYPAYGVYANVYMGRADTRVEFRIDDGEWKPMRRTLAPDPRVVRENMFDADADTLRGYDRSAEATPSPHLWRGALPTDLPTGVHRIEVRAFDAWRGEVRAQGEYRLHEWEASP
jgi:C terminal of Calcineurin-like phosphoesterase/N terminal of Calcineurin-like phosphoesterase/Calcineurin-like phosphoesterase